MRKSQKMPFTQRVVRFMYGRNGYDKLSRALMIACMVVAVVNVLLRSVILIGVETALIVYATFRVLSKNLCARRRENEAYCRFAGKVAKPFRLWRNKWRDRKTHVYRKCPHCKNVLRLPKARGKHTVNCPCCHTRFDIKV